MKKLLVGMVLGLFLFPVVCDVLSLAYFTTSSTFAEKLFTSTLMPSYGLTLGFEGNCTKDVSHNGHGWEFITREYYQCGKLNIMISDLIYGEYGETLQPKQ